MNKKILLINGHPDIESFNFALMDAYKKGVLSSNNELKEIIVRELDFNLNLQYGYRKRTDLEPDLIICQEKIQWADHIVLFYPVWWGSIPAILKGFFDRVLLPGFAFEKRENSVWWDKKLKGKSARIICTLDQPTWYYRLVYSAPTHKAVKKMTLQFCGINPVKITSIGSLRLSKERFREKWISKIESLGKKSQ